jgi:phosphoribosylaminoimidazolecarboxamide formyltransferase/IMP cyclohydrolase
MAEDLKKAYRTVMDDPFPADLEVSYGRGEDRQTLIYEKVSWVVDGVDKGLRYGENPGQPAALYRLVNGNLVIGDVRCVEPGQGLVTAAELHQFGKHPGKINLTDADNALNILRYLPPERPAVTIMKHNNPCGAALGETLAEAYVRADLADRVAAFGGCIACNRPVDATTAEEIAGRYAEVVVAPGFESGVVDILARRKNLRIMEIRAMERLGDYAASRFVDFKSLIDGGLVLQLSYVPELDSERWRLAEAERDGERYRVEREPSAAEWADMRFGWAVEAGVTSNSVIYVKDGATVGIGTGEQDRVGVAEIARDKAYRKLADRLCFERWSKAYNALDDADPRAEIDAAVAEARGGLPGASMISDAFFPFRDGVDVGLREGVTAVLQAGGSLNDHQSIQAVNEAGATMVFTAQRSFKH